MKKILQFLTIISLSICFSFALQGSLHARKVVCIDSASYSFNSFSANREGWEWQNHHAGDEIHVTAHLDSCLAQVMDGDTLVIITHGFPGGFTWGGQDYDGFGNDTGAVNPHPVPPGFSNHQNVFVRCCFCYSAYTDDSTRAVTEKIKDALGGAGQGNGSTGFPHIAWSENCVMISGGTKAQRDTAAAIIKRDTVSHKLPPPNRIPPTVPNQQTELQRKIDSALNGRHVVITGIYYKQPKDTILPGPSGGCIGGGAFGSMDITPGGVMLLENFDYPVSDSLGAYGWINFSGGIVNRYIVNPGSLSFPNYPLSGIGNLTVINNTGQDDYKDLYYAATSGSVYAYFLVGVNVASAGGDYFAAFLPSNSTTNFEGRVYVRNVGGLFAFGISKSTDPPVYGPPLFPPGQPLLVVLKYKFNTTTSIDDQMSLFVFNNTMPPTEPPAYAGPVTGPINDLPNVQRFAIRQGNAAQAPILAFDGLKVSQSWGSTTMDVTLAHQGYFSPVTYRHSLRDVFLAELRSSFPPYNLISADTSRVDSVSLVGSFEFPNVFTGNHFLVIKHMNAVDTWSKPGGMNIVQGGNYTYDFTTSPTQAFGNNMIAVGPKQCFYAGEVTGDDCIDVSDIVAVYNLAINFVKGYLPEDVNGDNFVDAQDLVITYNNSINFVCAVYPR